MTLEPMYRAVNGSLPTQITAAITASAVTIEVEDASVLPDAPNLMTISMEDGAEVIRYGTKNGNVLGECLRGFGGTSAQIWQAGTVCYRAYTAYDHNTFAANVIGVNAEVDTLKTTKQDSATLADGAFAYFGTGEADIARGNHAHAQYLTTETDPTVPGWAKAAQKPAYTAAETGAVPVGRKVNNKELSADIALSAGDVGAVPTTRMVNTKPLSADIVLNAADVGAAAAAHTHAQYLTTETDPTVPAWAKAAAKPTYTAAETGAVPTARTVNGKALSGNITLTAADVNAVSTSQIVITNVAPAEGSALAAGTVVFVV